MNRTRSLQKFDEVDGIWIHKEENVHYFSGFTGDSTDLLIARNKRYLFTDARYTEQAHRECPEWEVIDHGGHFAETLVQCCEDLGVHSLGIEAKALTVAIYRQVAGVLKQVEIVDVDLDPLRAVKTEKEIDALRIACRIADDALVAIRPLIAVGRTENELRLALEKAMLDGGSEGVSFATIVASGKRSSLPHGTATNKKIQLGDFLTFDFGATYQGYHSDMTRTFLVGPATERQKEIYQTVLTAQIAGVQAVQAGITGVELDDIVRKILAKADLARYFTHSLGHGVGLEIHEEPRITGNKEPLETGMVITIEPGVYLPEYGLRIEDTVVVREKTSEVLTRFPKHLDEI